jgi:phospholipid transport system substrate-binding protein
MGQILHLVSMGRLRGPWVPVMMVAVGLACGSPPALAQSAGQGVEKDTELDRPAAHPHPLDVVKSSLTRVLAAAGGGQQKKIEARRAAEELFDFDEMSRRMLADYWQESSSSQQGEFVRLFTELLERSYLNGLRSVPPAAVTFLGETVNGSYAEVKSRIATSRFGETSVEYRLVDHDGRWAVYDVVLDGVSLVSSYRSQFTSILRTSSFAQLLEKLRSREQSDPRNGQGP